MFLERNHQQTSSGMEIQVRIFYYLYDKLYFNVCNVYKNSVRFKFSVCLLGGEEEDVIRCICGLYRDEGLMIQCERCLVWQHCECVKADPAAAIYHCERCVPRDVDLEIPLDEYTEHGHR